MENTKLKRNPSINYGGGEYHDILSFHSIAKSELNDENNDYNNQNGFVYDEKKDAYRFPSSNKHLETIVQEEPQDKENIESNEEHEENISGGNIIFANSLNRYRK